MRILTKIISGASNRKTRLHDEKGNFVGIKKLLSHGPSAMVSGSLRIMVGYRPPVPWIAYSSIDVLEKFLTKRSRVLEFGSGMSTVWYAKKAGEVCSVEDYKPWYEKVAARLSKDLVKNVKYHYEENAEDYARFMRNDEVGFDLIMVDGSCRSRCVESAIQVLKPGGIFYLDNSDKDSGSSGGDMRNAESLLRHHAASQGAVVVETTDFAPTQLFVQQGMYFIRPKT